MRDVNLRKALHAWAMLGNELMLSRFMAGEKIVDAVVRGALTFDNVGQLADIGEMIKTLGGDPEKILLDALRELKRTHGGEW